MHKAFKNFYFKITGLSTLQYQNSVIRSQLNSLSRKTNELEWAQIFNNTIAGSSWLRQPSLSPGRWAAGYPMLYLLYKIYNQIRPSNIIEFGLGETSKLLYYYNKSFSESRYVIVEHDHEWVSFFANEFEDIGQNIFVLPVYQAQVNDKQVFQYDGLLKTMAGEKFDLVVIDGPWGSPCFSRYQIVQMVEENLIAEEFIIIMDDFDREGEKQTIECLKSTLQKKDIDFSQGIYSGVKDTYIICCKKYGFLTSM